jgi:quinol monooxygenase YgiN
MTVTFEVKALAGKLEELYQTLQALLPTMRDEKGCRDCRVSRDVESGEVFLFISDWELKSSFDGYMHSDNGRVLLGAVKLLGESARIRMSSDARWRDIGAVTFKSARTGVEEPLPSKDNHSKEFLLEAAGSQKKTEGNTSS